MTQTTYDDWKTTEPDLDEFEARPRDMGGPHDQRPETVELYCDLCGTFLSDCEDPAEAKHEHLCDECEALEAGA